MSKLKYLYSIILGMLNHFILSTIPITSYYYLAPHQTPNFDPLHLTIVIIIANIILCIYLEKLLFSKVSFKQCIFLAIIQLFSWIISLIITLRSITDYSVWGIEIYYILWGINFMFVLISSIGAITTSNK